MLSANLKVVAVLFICLVCFMMGRIWDEAHDRRTEREKLVQVKKELKLFEQENEIVLRTVLQDLQALEKEFETVERKENNHRPIREIEMLIDDLFSGASSNKVYREQIDNSTRFEDFDSHLAHYIRQGIKIEEEIQEVFIKTPPALFSQEDRDNSFDISTNYPYSIKSGRPVFLEKVIGTDVTFSKMFPRLYALQLKQNLNLNMIPGAGKISIPPNGSQSNYWVHFDREFLLKSSSKIRSLVTSLRLSVTYNVDEQKLDIKFDYRGLPI